MPTTEILGIDLQDPRVWLVLALLLLLLLYIDHQPYPLDFTSIFDTKMHHEDLILWLLLFMLYCLWKLSMGR